MKTFVFALVALCLYSGTALANVSFGVTPLNVSPAGTRVSAVIGDVDGDGRNDLVVVSGGELRAYSVAADGTTTLEHSVALVTPAAGWSYAQPRLADVDGNGIRDICLYLRADGQPGLLQIVRWSAGQFVVDGPYTMPESDAAYGFDMADIDGDGIPDAITANHGMNAPQAIFVTSGASGFTSSTTVPFPFNGVPGAFGPTQRGIVYVYARDLDGDGRIDVAVSTAPYNNVAGRIFWNRPGLGLTTTQDLAGRPSIDLGIGDQNGDGRQDIVANGDHTFDILIYRGLGFTTTALFHVPQDPRTPVVGDFSGDGRPDIALAMTSNKYVIIIVGGAQGSTAVQSAELTAADFMPDAYVQELTSGDVDNDGKLDLIFATDRVLWIRAVPDTVAPVLTLPSNKVAEATSAAGARVTYTAFAVDAQDGGVATQCSPASGSTFALGTTTVNCTAKDLSNNVANGSFTVTVRDTTPPVLSLPAPITTASPVVTFTATATDLVSGNVAVQCSPASGSTFAAGTTAVSCTASDAAGNTAHGAFNVTVTAPSDTTPPVLALPGPIMAEATSAGGAVVTYTTSATDAVDGPVAVQCSPASGSLFALGTTNVTCSASDRAGNRASAAFSVTVRDTTPPVLSLPAPIVAEAGTAVTYAASATDLVDGAVSVQCSPASGSLFALGTTNVACSASDRAGNRVSGSFSVTVRDTTPPVISSVTASANVLRPPNHKLVNVAVSVVARDSFDPAPVARIVSVTSNEPDNGLGDGDQANDIVVTGALTLQLRGERSGLGNGRVYTITVAVSDHSGNTSTATVQVTVPK